LEGDSLEFISKLEDLLKNQARYRLGDDGYLRDIGPGPGDVYDRKVLATPLADAVEGKTYWPLWLVQRRYGQSDEIVLMNDAGAQLSGIPTISRHIDGAGSAIECVPKSLRK
jgi:hypothetical protein